MFGEILAYLHRHNRVILTAVTLATFVVGVQLLR